uniref:Uncharacterized protein n=1 Tax=Romanomermis culicivorax TaxID=13658 RepID=A0A915KPE3_ROMCU
MEQQQTIMMTALLEKIDKIAINKSKSSSCDVLTTARLPALAKPILEYCLLLPVAPSNQPSTNPQNASNHCHAHVLAGETDSQVEEIEAEGSDQPLQSGPHCTMSIATSDPDLTNHEPAPLDKLLGLHMDKQKLEFALKKMTKKTRITAAQKATTDQGAPAAPQLLDTIFQPPMVEAISIAMQAENRTTQATNPMILKIVEALQTAN